MSVRFMWSVKSRGSVVCPYLGNGNAGVGVRVFLCCDGFEGCGLGVGRVLRSVAEDWEPRVLMNTFDKVPEPVVVCVVVTCRTAINLRVLLLGQRLL